MAQPEPMRGKLSTFAVVTALAGTLSLGAGASAEAAPGDYQVMPRETLRYENATARAYRATDTDGDAVDIALFTCDRVHSESTDPRFDSKNGKARFGDPNAEITEVEGEPRGTSYVEHERAGGDEKLRFEVEGSDDCVQPVVFRDRNDDRKLDLDARERPDEPYGIGGRTRFVDFDLSSRNASRCDVIDPAVCLFPWPNDHFTRESSGTDTGRRVNLARDSMPENRFGKEIEPSDYNRSDGFSPGQLIVTKVPGLESQAAFEETGAVPITDVERSFDPDQPVVVINARTGERQLIWSEIDSNPDDADDVALLIRPAVNFEEGERYIVALRNLKDADGDEIDPQPGFRMYRKPIITDEPAFEQRRPHMEDIFDTLGDAGIERDELHSAWDFTVASERNLSERALSIRDRGFNRLDDQNLSDLQVDGDAPPYQVTSTQNYDPCENDGCDEDPPPGEDPESDTLARQVEGQVVVPCFLDQPGCPSGSKFAYRSGSDNIPQRIPGNTTAANFTCNVPRSAVEGGSVDPARPSLYGHGLLGSADEVGAGNVQRMGDEHNMVFCATDWAGFSTKDVPNVVTILQDLSRFPTLVDHSQQGFLNFMYLGRLMIHPEGFTEDPAFQFDAGGGSESVLDTTRLFYDGNSQGGILGGSLTSLAPDFERAVLGVPGMNYSTLLRRSVDFDRYAEGNVEDVPTDAGLYDNYPDELERPLILSMIQMLWDRGEANGYAHHMTDDPLADTPSHEVLLHPAFGDHQVANVTAEVEARTIGAHVHQPALDAGRHSDVDPYFGIPAIDYPSGGSGFGGSALVIWDSGTPTPPIENVPPRPEEGYGEDPHGHPRAEPAARQQKSDFLKVDGGVTDVCGGPCYADGYTGTGP